MPLDQIANVAEIIGVVVVVITVIYLALQIRQNTHALRSNTAQATHDSVVSGYNTLATDGDLNRLFRKGCGDPAALTEDELGQFIAFWTSTLFMTQNWLYQRAAHALDDELTDTWLNALSVAMHSPGFGYYWKHRSYQFSARMREYIETVLAQPANPDFKVLGVTAE